MKNEFFIAKRQPTKIKKKPVSTVQKRKFQDVLLNKNPTADSGLRTLFEKCAHPNRHEKSRDHYRQKSNLRHQNIPQCLKPKNCCIKTWMK